MGKATFKGKSTVALLVLALLISSIACIFLSASEGTAIGSAEELLTLMNTSSMWKGDYYLTADIDLSSYTGELKQAPVGASSSSPFMGKFDGKGFTVSGLDFLEYTARTARIGLFGATKNAEIRNLTVEGTVSSSGQDIGGIVGLTYGKTIIENCVNNCTVSGKANVGGIAGRTHNGADGTVVVNCVNNGDVTSSTKNAGGIVGGVNNTDGPLTVEKCINKGDVTAVTNVGGIVVSKNGAIAVGGVLGGNEKTGGTVAYCLDRGTVVNGGDAHRYIGQVVGYPSTKPTSTCYYTAISAGAAGGAVWKNVEAYLDFEFDILNTNKKWIVSKNGPMLSFARGKVEETVVKTVYGDANLDGVINLLDVVRGLKSILSDDTREIKDLNRDGNVGVADVLELVKVALNKGVTDNYIAGDFVILVTGNWAGNDFATTETETASVNKAIYERNKYMLDEYGVNIITKDIVESGSNTGSGVGYDALYAEYLSGTSNYDAAMVGAQDAVTSAYKALCMT